MMEIMLDKVRLERYEKLLCATEMHEESTEMIIPDKSPDVLCIVTGNADAYIKDKNVRDDKIDISGTIKGDVLYIAEGETEVRKLDVSMPFAYVIEARGASPSTKMIAKVCLKNFDVREINPRKISARATLEVNVSLYDRCTLEIASGILGSGTDDIYMKKCGHEFYETMFVQEKSFVINDDIELSSDEGELSSVLTNSVELFLNDTKIIGNKAILKGTADISYILKLGDGSLKAGECELPFSQIIDIDGMTEEDDLKNIPTVSAFELEPQYDATGKARYMTVTISAEVDSLVRRRSHREMIDDIYSLRGEVAAKSHELSCESLVDRVEKRVSVTESVEVENGVKRVLDVGVKVSEPRRRREEKEENIVCDAAINVMYIGEDDVLHSVHRRKNIICPVSVSAGNSYEAEAKVSGKSYSVGVGNEINVRFFTDFDITETNEIAVSVMGEAELYEEEETKAENFMVSVVRLDDECDIWTLAKEHKSTVEEIKLANNITEDSALKKGRMVLIPKRV